MQRPGQEATLETVATTGFDVKHWARQAAIEEIGWYRYRSATDDAFVDSTPDQIEARRYEAWSR